MPRICLKKTLKNAAIIQTEIQFNFSNFLPQMVPSDHGHGATTIFLLIFNIYKQQMNMKNFRTETENGGLKLCYMIK